ncbi:SAM-dependent methyltransferase [Serinicoccus kebangsaanensis]|uniref:SAM-dependent methyltransferase n=1 Tax=Serinicoccus kebangsaanensis TaxID=2602069 RepID=UPI00124C2468|nr:SAM-dependent methyltransferase [Serinicoccus kebangsaanensis]
MVARPVAPEWLALRRAADHQARAGAQGLLDELTGHLRDRDELLVVDVGAGTGSNQAWLAPRLPGPQHWILVDHDPALLGSVEADGVSGEIETERAVATVGDLAEVLPPDRDVVLTCAALLDLLRPAELDALAEVIAPAGRPGVPALLSLTVTGEVALDPGHPDDATVAAAFDAHQRRDGLLGPDAATTMAAALRRRGAHVELAATDWVLGPADEVLLRRYLDDRAAVVVEERPDLDSLARAWRAEREWQLQAGALTVRVGHVDLLSLPSDAPQQTRTGR